MYVIGKTDFEFIEITHKVAWYSSEGDFLEEIDSVKYDSSLRYATIFSNYEAAMQVLDKIQKRTMYIHFENSTILGNIIDKRDGFNKFDYAKQLKIYRLVPELVSK